MAYHRQHKVDTAYCPHLHTYGPRMDLEDGRALPNLLSKPCSVSRLTVYGDGYRRVPSAMWMIGWMHRPFADVGRTYAGQRRQPD